MTTNDDTGSTSTDNLSLNKAKDILDNLNKDDSSINHIKNIDLYDRMNFHRIQVKRSSVKSKTNVLIKTKLNIEKFTEEIVKYVEDIPEVPKKFTSDLEDRSKRKPRTIKFATQKVTFQYPKTTEKINSNFSDCNTSDLIKEEDDEEGNNKNNIGFNNDDDKQEENKNIFVFGNEDDEDESKEDKNNDEKPHINLNLHVEEK